MGGFRNADRATLLSTPQPPTYLYNRQFPGHEPPGPLLLRPLSRPHRYRSGPASAFHCLPRGNRCPRSAGKSFWCLRGAWYLISTGTIWPFPLFKKGTSEPSSPGRKCPALIPDQKGISGSVFRDVMIILCPCGDLGKQHTHCKQNNFT